MRYSLELLELHRKRKSKIDYFVAENAMSMPLFNVGKESIFDTEKNMPKMEEEAEWCESGEVRESHFNFPFARSARKPKNISQHLKFSRIRRF